MSRPRLFLAVHARSHKRYPCTRPRRAAAAPGPLQKDAPRMERWPLLVCASALVLVWPCSAFVGWCVFFFFFFSHFVQVCRGFFLLLLLFPVFAAVVRTLSRRAALHFGSLFQLRRKFPSTSRDSVVELTQCAVKPSQVEHNFRSIGLIRDLKSVLNDVELTTSSYMFVWVPLHPPPPPQKGGGDTSLVTWSFTCTLTTSVSLNSGCWDCGLTGRLSQFVAS